MRDGVEPMVATGEQINPSTMMAEGFRWDDPFFLEDQLTQDERAVRDLVGKYAEEKLAPRIHNLNRQETFDTGILEEMSELGLFGAPMHGYGCPGINYVSYGLACRELERVDSAFRSVVSVQTSLTMNSIYAYGSEEQKQEYLPRLASAELMGSFGLTEPDTGSDVSAIRTRARRCEGGYRLTGTKSWITHAPIANFFVIWAKDDEGTIGAYLLKRGTDGLSTTEIKGKFGLRASPTGQVILEDAFVPEDNVLPEAKGLKAPLGILNTSRFGICWGVWGAAETCWRVAREYALERSVFGSALAGKQLVQKKLVDMQSEIAFGLQACLRVSRLRDQGRATTEQISILKRSSAGKALEIARAARDVLGGNGISDEYPVVRHMMNLEVINTLEGTSDIHALMLGRAQTRLSAF